MPSRKRIKQLSHLHRFVDVNHCTHPLNFKAVSIEMNEAKKPTFHVQDVSFCHGLPSTMFPSQVVMFGRSGFRVWAVRPWLFVTNRSKDLPQTFHLLLEASDTDLH